MKEIMRYISSYLTKWECGAPGRPPIKRDRGHAAGRLSIMRCPDSEKRGGVAEMEMMAMESCQMAKSTQDRLEAWEAKISSVLRQ